MTPITRESSGLIGGGTDAEAWAGRGLRERSCWSPRRPGRSPRIAGRSCVRCWAPGRARATASLAGARSIARTGWYSAIDSIEVLNTSTYPPQEKNPKGERHEDRGYISYDTARKQFVFRQFHVEGFVNTYVASPTALPIVFGSEAIENIPAGSQGPGDLPDSSPAASSWRCSRSPSPARSSPSIPRRGSAGSSRDRPWRRSTRDRRGRQSGRGVTDRTAGTPCCRGVGSPRSSQPTRTTRSAAPVLRSVVTWPVTCTVFCTLAVTGPVTATGTISPGPARHPTTTTGIGDVISPGLYDGRGRLRLGIHRGPGGQHHTQVDQRHCDDRQHPPHVSVLSHGCLPHRSSTKTGAIRGPACHASPRAPRLICGHLHLYLRRRLRP